MRSTAKWGTACVAVSALGSRDLGSRQSAWPHSAYYGE